MSSTPYSGPRSRQAVPASRVVANRARLGRVALALLLLVMASSYVRPALDWVSARGTAGQQEERLQALRHTEERLQAEKRRLTTERGLDGAARELGMVRSGERTYVVRGLPKD
ncbi:septum formation initiator family protein [Patulibacter sp. S7RM1-6]